MEVKSKEEIGEMLAWLNRKIFAWELRQSKPVIGSAMNTSQCQSSRLEYAAWIAHRDFLIRLIEKHY